ncbi:MAG: tetratricopeptide repeat protein, partial [Myxococcota bacterium]
RVPEDWRTGEVALPPPGVGLALFVLRTLPFVGREEERDRLWERLRSVVGRRRSEVVVVRGSGGIGKSRLARWLGESAHALAGVPYLLGDARVGESATDALSRPFRRWFRTIRLSTEQRIDRLRRFLGSTRADAVEAAASFTADGFDEQAELGQEARFTTARLLLEHLAGPSQGVVLVIDDAHRSPDVIRFGAYLLRTQRVRPIPVLMVMVTDQAPDAEAAEALAELGSEVGATELEIGPLPRVAHERLVGSMLPFEPSLAERVVDRTVGHPQHAVSVVRSWVSAHELSAIDGVYIRADRGAHVPPMAEVWRAYLRRLFDDLPDARPVLERAAVLGPAVEEEEWQRATDDPHGTYAAAGRVNFRPETARLRARLRERLQAERLVDDTETGLVFVVESFRQGLIALAREAGALEEHHRACARALLQRPAAHRCDERVGRHLVAGDCPAQAVAHLVEAWRHRLACAGERAAYPLLGEIEDALRQARIPATDLRWAELAVRRAELACRMNRVADARRAAADAEKRARIGGWVQLHARAAVVLAEVRLRAGDADEAEAALSRAEELLVGAHDPVLAGSVATLRAGCARAYGDFSVAAGQVERAIASLTAAEGDPQAPRATLADRWTTLGTWSERDTDLQGAERCFSHARALHLRDRATSRVAQSSLSLAGVVRARGDTDGARRWFVDALDRFREAGHPGAVTAALGLARIELARRDWVEAHRLASDVLGRAEDGPDQWCANAVVVAAAAGMRDWPSFDSHLARVGAGGPEVAWCLRVAEANADTAGQDARARKLGACAARLEAGG